MEEFEKWVLSIVLAIILSFFLFLIGFAAYKYTQEFIYYGGGAVLFYMIAYGIKRSIFD